MNRSANSGRGNAKRIQFKGNTFRSPRGTRIKEGAISVIDGFKGGTVLVSQGYVVERWYRVCER